MAVLAEGARSSFVPRHNPGCLSLLRAEAAMEKVSVGPTAVQRLWLEMGATVTLETVEAEVTAVVEVRVEAVAEAGCSLMVATAQVESPEAKPSRMAPRAEMVPFPALMAGSVVEED